MIRYLGGLLVRISNSRIKIGYHIVDLMLSKAQNFNFFFKVIASGTSKEIGKNKGIKTVFELTTIRLPIFIVF